MYKKELKKKETIREKMNRGEETIANLEGKKIRWGNMNRKQR